MSFVRSTRRTHVRTTGLACVALALLLASSSRAQSSAADSLATDSLATVAERVVPSPERGGLARTDRLQHASLAFATGVAIGIVTDEPLLGAGGAMTLGLAKEWFDRNGSGFDRTDLLADAVGAALAAWLLSGLSR